MKHLSHTTLVNEVISKVNADSGTLTFKTESGRNVEFHHYQDCCESVYISKIKGDLNSLIGKKITCVEEYFPDIEGAGLDERPYDSYTITQHVFTAGDIKVTVYWLGESNGYYSESVHIREW